MTASEYERMGRCIYGAHIGLADAIDRLGYYVRTASGLRELAAALPVATS